MKKIKPSANEHQFPNQACSSVECRKRDLVIRIADWTRQSIRTGEPGYDVEVYIGGVYSNKDSEQFTLSSGLTKAQAKAAAIEFACGQIKKLL